MKKKVKRIVLLFAAVCLGLTAFGCRKADAPDSRMVMLNDFETYDADYKSVDITPYFGWARPNYDMQYVTDGKASMSVCPSGAPDMSIVPEFVISTKYDNIPTMDFTAYRGVRVNIFNAQPVDVNMTLCAQGADKDAVSVVLPEREYVLKSGQWNTVYYGFGDGSMKKGFPVNNIQRFTFRFPDTTANPYNPDMQPLYFDGFAAVTGDYTYAPQRAADELLAFENAGDVNLLTTISNNICFTPNTDRMFVSQGIGSAKGVKKGSNNAEVRIYLTDGQGSDVLDRAKLAAAEGVSIDLHNGDMIIGNYTFRAVFRVGDTTDTVEAAVTRQLAGDVRETFTLTKDSLPDGYKLEDALYFSIVTSSEIMYVDHMRTI